ncbi:dephospho-CoA kinase [Fusobacterium sp. PH5-44]|uniref:dephospho-CoA kinase n=1 Tax=unclassified Fusobacterium TaxID=2648384 RepID=UPI003D1F124E
MVLGLTGGIASGKTTVSDLFKTNGIPVYDADIISKEVTQRNDIIEKIINIFPQENLLKDKKLDRNKLKHLVFNNREKLYILNEIIHPEVIKKFQEIRENQKEQIIVFDIPLLLESGCEILCDKILVIGAHVDTQIKRVMLRDNISRELAEKIIASQMSLDEKIKRADYVIWNDDKSQIQLQEDVERICESLLNIS